MSVYPGAYDTFRSPDNLPGHSYDVTQNTTVFSEDFSTRSDAILAVEETLGINPQGTYSTVVERLDAMSGVGAGAAILGADQTFTGLNSFDQLPRSTATPSNAQELVTKMYVDGIQGDNSTGLIANRKVFAIYNTDIASGTAMSANTWTTVFTVINFTTITGNALVEFCVGGNFRLQQATATSTTCGARLGISSDGTNFTYYTISGNASYGSGQAVNVLAGAQPIYAVLGATSTPALRLQVLANQNTNMYCRPGTQATESLYYTINTYGV